ncbi:hypothetical protein [Polyangium jinanense]|uniref:Tetratricopeptide repeat protein n=1 Tax=Polyangium jinanense TaxID=2829994 RepID=A0A9X3WZ45_9BACT|nr:hypothetical protein [Polyangium jinanense]MDC3954739.1 hypothetical protein [Polyangium jinanense]MDC3961913.1 hypothetical protein [Polyangium jinanense]MDC3981042.1 hypothetical protein [Polyangium jinanense]
MRSVWPRLAATLALTAACHSAFVVATPSLAFAQAAPKGDKASVTSLIQRGSALFDDAEYEESIQTLSAALLRPGTSKQEKIEIYRLLAYNYIVLKRVDEADAAVRGLLVLDETYTLPPTESPRFKDFFKTTREKWEAEGKPGRETIDSPAAEKPIRIMHTSPAQVPPGTLIKLTGRVEDPDGRVRAMQLAYRTGADGKFVLVPASYTLGEFRAQIPSDAVKPPLVEYYLQAIDKGGLPLTSRGDAATPLRIAVPAAQKGGVLSSPWFWVPVGLAVVGGGVAATYFLLNQRTSTVTIRVTE